jgi:hypothetical protein
MCSESCVLRTAEVDCSPTLTLTRIAWPVDSRVCVPVHHAYRQLGACCSKLADGSPRLSVLERPCDLVAYGKGERIHGPIRHDGDALARSVRLSPALVLARVLESLPILRVRTLKARVFIIYLVLSYLALSRHDAG